MNPYRTMVLRWGHHRSFIPFVKVVAGPLDSLTRRFGRPFSTIGTGTPTMFLTTVGRKSGQDRTVPVFGLAVAGGVALIDSNVGQQHRPAWSYNLQANPRCRLQRGRETTEHVARAATPAERADIWSTALATWPAWQSYQDRLDRELDMFVLEPAGPAGTAGSAGLAGSA